jgi:hypothetical protein
MKNLLIHVNPEKRFTDDGWGNESDTLVKIQIDNSLELGWKREDILLVTNFPYEYNGVKSLVVDDENYCWPSRTATKINVFLDLIDKGMNDLYWFHDIDAFQLRGLEKAELELEGFDMGITEYGLTTIDDKHNKRMSTGCVFFRKEARDLFEDTQRLMYKHEANEEVCMLVLTKANFNNFNQRVKRLNLTYNFATRKRQIKLNYDLAEKPLKVLHFHPSDTRPIDKGFNNLEVLMYGKGSIGKPLMTDRLIKLFHKYDIK